MLCSYSYHGSLEVSLAPSTFIKNYTYFLGPMRFDATTAWLSSSTFVKFQLYLCNCSIGNLNAYILCKH
jgi:hypothetical protein